MAVAVSLCGSLQLVQARSKKTSGVKGLNNLVIAFKPKVDANGYISLHDCPRLIDNVKVDVTSDESGDYLVAVSMAGKTMDTFRCESTGADVHFVDANFDGYYDFVVGPATSRNYSQLYLWDSIKQCYYHAQANDGLNGYMLLNPDKKQWVIRGSSSYCSLYYTIFKWEGGREVDIESLIAISDSMMFHEYGVQRYYTIIKGADFENISKNLKKQTNSKAKLPKYWKTIIDTFNTTVK